MCLVVGRMMGKELASSRRLPWARSPWYGDYMRRPHDGQGAWVASSRRLLSGEESNSMVIACVPGSKRRTAWMFYYGRGVRRAGLRAG